MNKIDQLFQQKPGNILSVFFTAGYPQLQDTTKIIKALEKAGVDMIELGMPFSDPMADGPVIQKSNKVSLQNGMNLSLLFKQIKELRKITKIPVLLMGYLNPVVQYGIERFSMHCFESGIDGVILPDLPIEVYQKEFKSTFEKYNLYNIFLVSPTTSAARLDKILSETQGFVYMVSSSSTTGNTNKKAKQLSYIDQIRKQKAKVPVMIGFGIDSREKFNEVCQYGNGGIIGSAFIKTLDNQNGDMESRIKGFIESIKPEQQTVK